MDIVYYFSSRAQNRTRKLQFTLKSSVQYPFSNECIQITAKLTQTCFNTSVIHVPSFGSTKTFIFHFITHLVVIFYYFRQNFNFHAQKFQFMEFLPQISFSTLWAHSKHAGTTSIPLPSPIWVKWQILTFQVKWSLFMPQTAKLHIPLPNHPKFGSTHHKHI